MGRDRQRLKVTIELVIDSLRGKANVTSSDVSLHLSVKRQLVIFSRYPLVTFIDAKIAIQQIIMMAANSFGSNDFRNIGKAMMLEYTLHIFLAFQ